MSLGVGQDDEITIIIEGDDEENALKALTELIDSNFSRVPEV